MPFRIIQGDITTVKADVLVNAANNQLLAGSGVCGAIFRAAGYTQMQDACRRIGYCPTGDAVITPAFQLPARYVIHTVGPVWEGGEHNERELLYSCYVQSLALADAYGARSIAFPLISSGIFGYPREEALEVCEEAVEDFLSQHEMDVFLVIFQNEDIDHMKYL